MKQRMRNTFTRIVGDNILSKFLTNAGYFALVCLYVTIRPFLLRSNKKDKYDLIDERQKVEAVQKCPDMACVPSELNVDENIDLSIILPAFNMEKFLKKCIDSILNQKTDFNIELVIINDGSTDNTESIVKAYSDKRIKYICQENKGFSGARNTGLDNARGKYIMFVDSDDTLEPNCIDKLMQIMTKEQADMVVGSYYMFVEDGKPTQYFINENKVIENNPEAAASCAGYAWAKIYRRELFEKIRFPFGAWFEDTIMCCVVYRLAKKVVLSDVMTYGYRINPQGITRTAKKSTKVLDHYWVMEDVLRQAEINGLPKDELQYELVLGHMSTLLYRRLHTLEDEIIEATFAMARELVNDIRPESYVTDGNFIRRDIEKAFIDGNYKLWKLASFVL